MRVLVKAAVGAITLGVLAGAAQAQSANDCVLVAQDGCQKAHDTYRYLMPQLGLGLVGGNPVLGSSNVLGRLGRFSVGVRGTALNASVPTFDLLDSRSTGRVADDIPVEEILVPVPAVDAAIGLWGGIPLGVTRIGALDALVSVMHLPSVDDVGDGAGSIEVKSSTRFGFGARVGLLEENVVTPEVSFAFLQRGVPKVTVSSELRDGVVLAVEDLDITVSSWRVMVTKNLLAFGLNAGFGGDKYSSDATIAGRASGTGVGVGERTDVSESLSRTNWFVGVTLNLGPVKLGGEFGRGSKATVTTFNRFDPPAGFAQTYASAGLRLQL